jgi:PhnB protein
MEKIMAKNYAVNPYLFFNGRCQEAIDFYSKTTGAEQLMLMRYKDAPPEAKAQQGGCAGNENQVMHARLRIGDTTVMLSDGPCSGKYDGFALSLTTSNAADAESAFKALSAGGKVDMPMNKTFFSPAFGMLTDRFGVKWMVLAETNG